MTTSRKRPPGNDSRDDGRKQVPARDIFTAFLRLGAMAFGGPAIIAYMREMAVTRKRWITEESFRDGIVLCQSIPGATAMQMAAYVGLRAGGPRGALAAYVGFGLPAFALMLALSAAYQRMHDLQTVASVFRGLQVIVVALVANAALHFAATSVKNRWDVLLAGGAAVFLACHGTPILAIMASALLGIVVYRGETAVPATQNRENALCCKPSTGWVVLAALVAALVVAAPFLVNRTLLALTAVMLKVDLFAFGGGFASVPLMLHEIVDVRHWMDGKTFMDGIALGQVTPGPIVITATFAGYQVAGVAGACVATVGIFAPSFLMVLGFTPHFDRLQQSALFRRALQGVLASFVGLLFAVALQFGWAIDWSIPSGILALAALAALRLKVDILWVVLAGALVAALVL